jgi:TonB family protein
LAASRGGWVIASYELDGSGAAANIQIEKSEPQGVIDASVLRALQQTRFKAGVARAACRQAFQFNIKS